MPDIRVVVIDDSADTTGRIVTLSESRISGRRWTISISARVRKPMSTAGAQP